MVISPVFTEDRCRFLNIGILNETDPESININTLETIFSHILTSECVEVVHDLVGFEDFP